MMTQNNGKHKLYFSVAIRLFLKMCVLQLGNQYHFADLHQMKHTVQFWIYLELPIVRNVTLKNSVRIRIILSN